MKADEKIVRLVREFLQNSSDREKSEFDGEPDEPRPQECCGQSCKPCVFDIHQQDVVRWAKQCAKNIKYGDESLYENVYGRCGDEPKTIGSIFDGNQYIRFRISQITRLTDSTNLYKFETDKKIGELPLGCHLRARFVGHSCAKT
ncbi:unnamed protein product [Caenorhabditis bovis]|uniref:Oxidoreductase-like domain-containing protein n=1 Tax=Caenorhabditis bovis TaxID=2654633 RepID=A0A8S1FFZ3_9PELO|nr:unnamed protein product [Caenorhabditis bovis]